MAAEICVYALLARSGGNARAMTAQKACRASILPCKMLMFLICSSVTWIALFD
jgi:hypothetical protein